MLLFLPPRITLDKMLVNNFTKDILKYIVPLKLCLCFIHVVSAMFVDFPSI